MILKGIIRAKKKADESRKHAIELELSSSEDFFLIQVPHSLKEKASQIKEGSVVHVTARHSVSHFKGRGFNNIVLRDIKAI